MNLFLDKPLEFEKTGFQTRLSEDTNNWPQEILDELFRQAPYTSDYTPKVVLREIDQDRRYALGQVELMNRLSINPRDDDTPQELRGQQRVVVPVVVKEGRLYPMDILLSNGQVEPLTEERLRKAIFRPSLFEAVKQRPGDLSLVEQLYPPYRSGHAGGPLLGYGGIKEAGAKPEFLLDAILPTVKVAHVREVEDRLNSDPSLRQALLQNEAVLPFLQKLANKTSETSGYDYFERAAHNIHPTVVQIQKIAGGFRIKTANPQALIPTADDVDRPTAVGSLGGDLVSKVETDGTVTVTSQPAVKDTLEDLTIKVADEFGLYKVRTTDDHELVGWVFPKVMDLSGTLLPLAVFSNGSDGAIQENIAGIPVDRSADLIDAPPQGLGCFYHADASGATALVPMEVRSEVQTPEGTEYVCETILGEQVQVVKVKGLMGLTEVAEGRYAIPEDLGFLPLPSTVDLHSTPDEFTKTAQARALVHRTEVMTDGQVFSFRGAEVEKLASAGLRVQAVGRDDAMFIGAILGQEPTKFAHVLDTLHSNGRYSREFQSREVTTLRSKYAQAKKAAMAKLASFPAIRTDLLKEAAPIVDPLAVDKILSVGFINPENVMVFASYVPEIENVVKRLAELLLASRLGLSGVDEGALQKALIHLDKVLAGLRSLTATPQA